MKALSITQPWATLVALGAKRIETRSFRTSYRGPLAIHASKTFPRWAKDVCWIQPFIGALGSEPMHTGCVIATCDLMACVRTEDLLSMPPYREDMTEMEKQFGDYTEGRWGWMLANVKRLPANDPVKGALGLWWWDDKTYWQRREDFGPNGDATTPGFFKP